MKTLNLVDLDKSDIKYKISKFPDGQQNIVLTEFYYSYPGCGGELIEEYINIKIAPLTSVFTEDSYLIKSRLNNFKDLELIICAVASLRELGVEEIHLYTPYILGSRSDRKFEEGGNNYLKDVICPVINSLNFKTVTCIDPHSDVLEACIKGFRKESNLELVKKFFLDTYDKHPYKNQEKYPCILVSPDAGASKKIYKLAEQIGYKGDIITCSKDRDNDGNLTKTVVPELPINKDIIIIDDICDGGATFINIVKEIKQQYNNVDKHCQGKIYLIVTHGIFSKGFSELAQYFDGIYCTNSYKNTEFGPPLEKNGFCVKQLNVY